MVRSRIESIDILRGLVMVIMALDHVRDYFHFGSFYVDPTNIETTTPLIFFTRFITHFCAPVFVFLAGTSAFLYGSNKTKPELFKFLFFRGIWLILLEVVVNNLIWTFDPTYSLQIFQVIWAIGVSMICLSLLIFLPQKAILLFAVILIAGHNAFDAVIMQGQGFKEVLWYVLHQQKMIFVNPDHIILIQYPLVPWMGVMALGYLFGTIYKKDFDVNLRRRWLLGSGMGSIVLFFILRGINVYGDLVPWSYQDTIIKTLLSFINVTKYPPSLLYLLITLGPAMLFLYAIEATKNMATDFFLVFGRVPLFYYFIHMIVIHALAIPGILIFGGNWNEMVITSEKFVSGNLVNYGYSLLVVYLIWIGVVFFLYPLCKKYMMYKDNNKATWWLSYL